MTPNPCRPTPPMQRVECLRCGDFLCAQPCIPEAANTVSHGFCEPCYRLRVREEELAMAAAERLAKRTPVVCRYCGHPIEERDVTGIRTRMCSICGRDKWGDDRANEGREERGE